MTAEREKIEETTLSIYEGKAGAKSVYIPFSWVTKIPKLIRGEVRFVHETHVYPDVHYHDWFLEPGEQVPVCPDALIVCPCGCKKSFLINKKEQKSLKQSLGILR